LATERTENAGATAEPERRDDVDEERDVDDMLAFF
jgi:hypothetical protein